MKPSTNQCLGHERLSSANSADMKQATIPPGTSAIEVTVETNPARVTFTATGDPTSSVGLVIQNAWNPWFLPIGQGATFKVASTVGAASVVQLAYLS